MKKKILGLMVIGLLVANVTANATVIWKWSFSDIGGDIASGTLTTGDSSGGSYLITGISGTWDGRAITRLLAAGTMFGGSGTDNLLRGGTAQLDYFGFGFGVSGGLPSENIYYSSTYSSYLNCTPPGTSTCYGYRGTFAATPVPEPGVLSLLGLGLGLAGAGFVVRRRRR